jgi:penicillin-binding protein 1B
MNWSESIKILLRNFTEILNKFKERVKAKGLSKKMRLPFKRVFFLLLTAAGVVLALYVGYLDIVIRQKFDGKRWSLPAVVYARPLELFKGLAITADLLEEELILAGYRQESDVKDPGGYERSGDTIRLVSRDFHFADGLEKSMQLSVSFSGNRIDSIRRTDSGDKLSLARLDPARIGSFHPRQHEDRILVTRNELPDMLVRTLIAVEDKKFASHIGIDPLAIIRAAYVNFRTGAAVQGGSTLTQQLVKNFFLSNERTLWRKLNEAVMALLLEAHYSKDEILTAYVNEIFLGQDGERAVHGFALAAQFYFRRDLDDLKVDQIAVLVGMVKGPSYYDPRRHPERCRKRRAVILDVMQQQNIISDLQYRQASEAELLDSSRIVSGFNRFPAFLDLVRRQLARNYHEEDLTSDGLKILTTLDPRVQKLVESQLSESLAELEKQTGGKGLEGAVVVSARENGEILALTGGRKPLQSGFNRALDARRPVGSLIKPAVFLTALLNGYTLASPLEDAAITLANPGGGSWSPANFDRKLHGRVPLIEALVFSYNLATVKTGTDVGLEKVVQTTRRLGAEGELAPYPSFLLGAVAMTPLEVAQFYQTFASGGFYVPQRAINSVLAADNRLLQRYGLSVEQRFDPQHVFLINTALQRVVREGTGTSLSRYLSSSLQAAGKTGTSDDLRDSWFAGFTGDRLAVVWIGMDDNTPAELTGSSGALVVWGKVMAGLNTQPLELLEPPGIKWARVSSSDYGTESSYRGKSELLPFVEGTIPGSAIQASAPAPAEKKSRGTGMFERLRKWLPW